MLWHFGYICSVLQNEAYFTEWANTFFSLFCWFQSNITTNGRKHGFLIFLTNEMKVFSKFITVLTSITISYEDMFFFFSIKYRNSPNISFWLFTYQPNVTRLINFTPKSIIQHHVQSILYKCDKENPVSQVARLGFQGFTKMIPVILNLIFWELT